MAFIPGYLSTISVNGSAINIYSSDASLSLTNEVLDKTTLGVPERVFITGLQSGTMDATMHTDTAGIVDIQAAFVATTPVTCVFRPGALGTHDAGSYGFDAIITDMSHNGAVDDNWSTTLSLQVTGPVAYTQPA